MGSMPPNMPPPPPYDPRDYYRAQKEAWRAQREQQKAAARAQRDAYRAQMHYYGSLRRPSLLGPIFLIGIGVVCLLLMTGKLDRAAFFGWYSHWWPILLIGAGVALLVEWFFDRKSPHPFLRSTGIFGVLILLAIVGWLGGAFQNHGNLNFGPNFSMDDDDGWFNSGAEHINDEQFNVVIPANAQVQIQNPRGDVNIVAADAGSANKGSLDVNVHEVVRTDDDSEAKNLLPTLKPKVTVAGNTVIIRVEGSDKGRANLTLVIPADASVNVNSQHGDISVGGLKGFVEVTSNHGDIKLDSLGGSVRAHIQKGDFSAHAVAGNLDLNGRGNDVTISEVRGKVQVDGDYFGSTHFEHVSAPVHFHSSRTDITALQLPGAVELSDSDLHITSALGPVRVTTSSKDIEIGQVAGDIHVENSHGSVDVTPGNPLGQIEISNKNGNVKIALPEATGFNVDAHVHNGELDNEFNLPMMSGDSENKSLSGQVGKGGPRVSVNVTHGDLSLNRTSRALPMLNVPPYPVPNPLGAKPPKAPHLNAPKGEKVQTVVQ